MVVSTVIAATHIVIGLLSVGLSFFNIYYLLALDQPLFATGLVLILGLTLWSASGRLVRNVFGMSGAGAVLLRHGLAAAANFFLYVMFLATAAAAGAGVGIAGASPPLLVLLQAAFIFTYLFYDLFANELMGGGGMAKLFIGGIVFLTYTFGFVYGIALGGDWANAGELLGPQGYAITSTAADGYEYVAENTQGVANQLSPRRNSGMARLACSWEFFSEGNIYSSAAGGASIDQCVNAKLGQNETSGPPSEEVSKPVVVKIYEDEINLEPFPDHMRVEVPVENTLVFDVEGRPIDMPAENVRVRVDWYYLGKHRGGHEVPQGSDEISIPNGETRTFSFERKETGNFFFPVWQAESELTPRQIQLKLQAIKQNCDEEYTDEEGNVVESEVKACSDPQFELIDRMRSGSVSDERVGWLAESLILENIEQGVLLDAVQNLATGDGFTVTDFALDGNDQPVIDDLTERFQGEEFKDVCEYVAPFVPGECDGGPDENLPVLGPNRQYQVEATVSYTFGAEAAFTDASRWESQNNLLELWTREAWQDLSFDERQDWTRRKCGRVMRYGQEVQKQRTAALTTPVVPVMYTDCGSSLFRHFEADDAGQTQGRFNISIGATANADNIHEDLGFTILAAQTDCQGPVSGVEAPKVWKMPGSKGSEDASSSDMIAIMDNPQPITYTQSVGFIVPPAIVQRTVTIPGRTTSIGCRVTMKYRVNLKETREGYEIPEFPDLP